MAKRAGRKYVLTDEVIINKIYLIREQKVMLDKDLAEMYGIDTKVLKQAVKRNAERFPKDFMFTLTQKEFQNLRSQFVTSSWGGSRKLIWDKRKIKFSNVDKWYMVQECDATMML